MARSGSLDTTVRLWDVDSADCLKILSGHVDGVTGVAMAADGNTVASSGRDGLIILWNVATGQARATLRGHRGWVRGIALSPDGLTLLSCGSDATVRLWRVADGTPLAVHNSCGGDTLAVAFAPDGRCAAYGTVDRAVRLCRLSESSDGIEVVATLEGHNGVVRALAFSPDGATLASGGSDTTVLIWSLAHWTSGGGGSISITGVEPACQVDGAVTVKTLPRPLRLSGHSDCVTGLSYSPDSSEVVSSSDDKTVRVWSVSTGRLLATLTGHRRRATGVQYSPTGWVLVSCAADATARVWRANISDSTVADTLASQRHRGGVLGVSFSPDSACVASCGSDGSIRLWDAANGTCRATLDPPSRTRPSELINDSDNTSRRSVGGGTASEVRCVAFSPTGAHLASGSTDGVVRMWDVAKGTVTELQGHDASLPVYCVSFSADGRLLATGSREPQVRVWDLDTRYWPDPPRRCSLCASHRTADGSWPGWGKGLKTRAPCACGTSVLKRC